MASAYMKKCPASLTIRKKQKTITELPFTPERMAMFKKSNNNPCWQGHLSTLLVGIEASTIGVGICMEMLKNYN